MKTILALLSLAVTILALLTLAAITRPAVAASESSADAAKPAAALPAGHVPIAASPADIQLTRKGKVLEVIDSPMYTYLQVSGDKDPVWLAAYKIDVSKGAVVRYSDGVAMSNFHSKSLNRTFDTIVFVDRVVPEGK
ncbi:MAG: hypothetical protein HYU79_00595 [Nitrosomonadales bacterium]|nr:hypothetical protein [Nitrosomonadales bacterium]